MSEGETHYFDLDQGHEGFNVNYSLDEAPSFVNLSTKVNVTRTPYPAPERIVSVKLRDRFWYAIETVNQSTFLQYETPQGIYALLVEV
jgi:hypothetical protein